ncbi:MAG: hypothetical protein R3F13_17445 [Prosthecobacter sp.]
MTSVTPLTDFPDHLSPMVVKELRQGLRTRMFGLVMVLLHVLLVLFTLVGGGSGNAEIANTWFDGITTLTLCVILPLRGFSAVADELKAGTLDMLTLTSLSAGRIIFGKWASIAAQSLLLAFSILPYVVARYVFGGLDLFGEVAMLFCKWLGGVVFAALVIALSTQRQFWLRALIIGVPLLFGGCGMFSYFVMRGLAGAAGLSSPWSVLSGGSSSLVLAFGVAAWLIFYFLSLAATRVAPAASMLAVVKRSVNLVVFCLLLVILTNYSGTMVEACSPLLWLIMLDALTEHANEVPSVYAAFYRRSLPGRVALCLLAPGWMTGFLFTGLLTALFVGASWMVGNAEQAQLALVSACGVWMIAALVQMLPTRRARDLLLPFLCIAIAVGVVLSTLASLILLPFSMKGVTAWFAIALPPFVTLGFEKAQPGDKQAFLMLGTVISLLWPVVLAVLAAVAWRRTRSARMEALEMAKGGVD